MTLFTKLQEGPESHTPLLVTLMTEDEVWLLNTRSALIGQNRGSSAHAAPCELNENGALPDTDSKWAVWVAPISAFGTLECRPMETQSLRSSVADSISFRFYSRL